MVIGSVISETKTTFVKDRQIIDGMNVLMQAMVEGNRFVAYRVGGQEDVSVSHLQFADDTLLLGIKSWTNVRCSFCSS
jgi:hypothetical protein